MTPGTPEKQFEGVGEEKKRARSATKNVLNAHIHLFWAFNTSAILLTFYKADIIKDLEMGSDSLGFILKNKKFLKGISDQYLTERQAS